MTKHFVSVRMSIMSIIGLMAKIIYRVPVIKNKEHMLEKMQKFLHSTSEYAKSWHYDEK